MSEIERQYEYKPRASMLVAAALFFGVCAVVLGAKGRSNDRGLLISGLIELGVEGATFTYWVLAALSVGFVVLSAALLTIRLGSSQRVAFTRHSLMSPRSRWSNEEASVEYRDILQLTTSEVSGQRFLTIAHRTGTVTLVASMLPAEESLEEIWKELMARVEAAREVPAKKRKKRAAPARPSGDAGER